MGRPGDGQLSATVCPSAAAWYAMALVDILDVIPLDKTELREPSLEIIPELADSLIKTQDASGTWFQIMGSSGRAG